MNEATTAVVVTYNRKELLRECLHALLAQTHALGHIIVVDNVSTDGTPEMLRVEFAENPQIELVTLDSNRGGAGGFHQGMKLAAPRAEWVWLMDDDTIVTPTALAELFQARARFPEPAQPDLLASKVLWTDGSMHPMNVPRLKRTDALESMVRAAEQATVSIRATSFVSLLIRSRLVTEYGLPFADYFIWNDDVEYTARVLRREFGVLVPQSVVIHKTAVKTAEPDWKTYYGLRNTLWMVRDGAAWSGQEKLQLVATLVLDIVRYLGSGIGWPKLRLVGRALWHGLIRRPAQ